MGDGETGSLSEPPAERCIAAGSRSCGFVSQLTVPELTSHRKTRRENAGPSRHAALITERSG